MPKFTYTPREQEVADAPEDYVLRVHLGPGRGWWEKSAREMAPDTPLAAAKQFVREFREANPSKGILCYAVRKIDGEQRLASMDTEGW